MLFFTLVPSCRRQTKWRLTRFWKRQRWKSISFGLVFIFFSWFYIRESKPLGVSKKRLLLLKLEEEKKPIKSISDCSHFSCFDVYRCNAYGDYRISIYTYPDIQFQSRTSVINVTASQTFRQLRNSVRRSPFFTASTSNACIILAPVDFLYPQSAQLYNLSVLLNSLPK